MLMISFFACNLGQESTKIPSSSTSTSKDSDETPSTSTDEDTDKDSGETPSDSTDENTDKNPDETPSTSTAGVKISSELVDKSATENTVRLMHFLKDTYGKKIISGQMDLTWKDSVDMPAKD